MAKKVYTMEDIVQMVNCCYFVGSCRTCPFWKRTGYAMTGSCRVPKAVGQVLLDVFEPMLNNEDEDQPRLFELEEEDPEEQEAEISQEQEESKE
ncbi:MAG: hypothetical protein IJI14_12025 [Anaerolineaceae bacterium]|nr:hypothetical protein [Anaerolineaceae bacterium]